MSSSTATRRITLIPEILSQIFEYSSRDDQVRFARVCKTWSDIVVGLVWKHLWEVQVLLLVLAPLTMKDGKIAFSRPLTSKDWVRFDYYARRVLDLNQAEFTAHALHPDLIMEILVTRPSSQVLPRLRYLRLYPCTLDCASFFLHSTITSLRLNLEHFSPLLGPLISSLPTKTPRLAELSLYGDGLYAPDADVERILAEALLGLPFLTSLYLPSRWITCAIVNAAATCPTLKDLATSPGLINVGEMIDPSEFEHLFSTSLPVGGFPSLNSINVPIPFSRATNVLLQGDHFNVLTRFQVASPWIESPQAYEALLAVLSACCPNLEFLSLSTVPVHPATVDYAAITFNDIAPVTRLTGLQHLSLHHPMPFQLVIENVVTIARALPCITNLSLNPAPDAKGVSTLSVGVLSPLLDFCPDIHRLGLYMNTSDEHIPSPTSDEECQRAVIESERLMSLVELDVGKTSISSPIPLSIYLSRVLPPHCSIEAYNEEEEEEEVVVYGWAEVVRLIPAFKQVRAEGTGIRNGRSH